MFYIKLFTLFMILLQLTVYLDARCRLNEPAFKINNTRYKGVVINAPIISSYEYNIPISKLLYLSYELAVFNSMYDCVKFGKYYFIKNIKINRVLWASLYYFVDFSRIMYIILLFFVKQGINEGIRDALNRVFEHSVDNRKLVRIDNIWVANNDGVLLKIISNIANKRGEKIKLTLYQKKFLLQLNERLRVLTKQKQFQGVFIKPGLSQIKHIHYSEICKDSSAVGYRTDFKTAEIKNNYGNRVIINRFSDTKLSKVLQIKLSEIKQIGITFTKPIIYELQGASRFGYSEDLLSDKYRYVLEEYNSIQNDFVAFSNEVGWYHIDNGDTVLGVMTKCDTVSLEDIIDC